MTKWTNADYVAAGTKVVGAVLLSPLYLLVFVMTLLFGVIGALASVLGFPKPEAEEDPPGAWG